MDDLFIRTETGELGQHVKKVIESYAKEMMAKLDVGKKGYLNWTDFKEYKSVVAEHKERLLTYLYSIS